MSRVATSEIVCEHILRGFPSESQSPGTCEHVLFIQQCRSEHKGGIFSQPAEFTRLRRLECLETLSVIWINYIHPRYTCTLANACVHKAGKGVRYPLIISFRVMGPRRGRNYLLVLCMLHIPRAEIYADLMSYLPSVCSRFEGRLVSPPCSKSPLTICPGTMWSWEDAGMPAMRQNRQNGGHVRVIPASHMRALARVLVGRFRAGFLHAGTGIAGISHLTALIGLKTLILSSVHWVQLVEIL